MTRKHFEAIASIFAAELSISVEYPAQLAIRNIILSSADVFASTNPRFDRARFYVASGLAANGQLA